MTLTLDALHKAGCLRKCFAQSGPEAIDWLATCEAAIRRAADASRDGEASYNGETCALAAFGLEPK